MVVVVVVIVVMRQGEEESKGCVVAGCQCHSTTLAIRDALALCRASGATGPKVSSRSFLLLNASCVCHDCLGKGTFSYSDNETHVRY